MLQEIYINNFVLIDELRLGFDRGLNVLTGETGAGKSIIIDALGLILGERIKNDFIRDNNRKAIAEAVFDIKTNHEARLFLMENGILDEEETIVVVSREISTTGRNSARINGRTVTAGLLKTLGSYLLDMHLQHDNIMALNPEMYLQYVDHFSPESEQVLNNLQRVFLEMKEKKQLLLTLRENEQNRLQKIDFLQYQIAEIEQAGLQPGEDTELLLLSKRIKNAVNLEEGAERLIQLLYAREQGDSAYDLVSAALDITGNLKEEFFLTLQQSLEDIYYSLQDMAGQLDSYRDSLDFEPGLLEETEDRLHLISRLKSKYGNSIEEIHQFLESSRKEMETLISSREKQAEVNSTIAELENQYTSLAHELTQIRNRGAQRLQDTVHMELMELNMPDIKFAVSLEARDNPSIHGMDRVDFLFSPNPGEEMRTLARIASGGEISRFILALKKALAEFYNVPTLIFDEIDVGVGGTALAAMAAKLFELSHQHQVILVTHSPQVASFATQHFLIEKALVGERVCTKVRELDEEGRTSEIARMLEGEKYTGLALEHAREMLQRARYSQSE